MARITLSGGSGVNAHPVYTPSTLSGGAHRRPLMMEGGGHRPLIKTVIKPQIRTQVDSIRAGGAMTPTSVPTMMGGQRATRFVHNAPISTVSMKGGARDQSVRPIQHDSMRGGAMIHTRTSVLPTLPGGAHVLSGFVAHQPPIQMESHSLNSLAHQHTAPPAGGSNVLSLDAGKTVLNLVGVNDLKNGPHQR